MYKEADDEKSIFTMERIVEKFKANKVKIMLILLTLIALVLGYYFYFDKFVEFIYGSFSRDSTAEVSTQQQPSIPEVELTTSSTPTGKNITA